MLPEGCEDARGVVSGVGDFLCVSNLGVSRLGFLSARAMWGSSILTTHGVALAAGFLARAFVVQWQIWVPVLGMISGRAGDLKSRAALHKPVASRKMHKPPNIAVRMSNGTPRKPCTCVPSKIVH